MSQPMMPFAKRRRLDESTSILSKPFKSPLRRNAEARKNACISLQQERDDHVSTTSSVTKAEEDKSLKSMDFQAQSSSTKVRDLPTILPSSPGSSTTTPHFLPLQKQHSALLLQLSSLRQSLDTAQQASKLQASNQDAELEGVIRKWRFASREAAEEVFRGAKERVNRMGGISVWRERSRQEPQGWAEGPEADLEDLTEERREQLEIQKEELQAECEKYGPGKVKAPPEKDDEVRLTVSPVRSVCH